MHPYQFRVFVVGNEKEGIKNNQTALFLAPGVHGDEPGAEVLDEVVNSLHNYAELLRIFNPIYVFDVISGGTYEIGRRTNREGTDVNDTFWVPENGLPKAIARKPEEAILFENFVNERYNPHQRAAYVDLHGDDRYIGDNGTVYVLANSDRRSIEIARLGLQGAKIQGVNIHPGDIHETDETSHTGIKKLVNEGGVVHKDSVVYGGAWGPSNEARSSSNPPVELTFEINYATPQQARYSGRIAVLSTLQHCHDAGVGKESREQPRGLLLPPHQMQRPVVYGG